jgi:glycosyltransferase involved in cell wall biosynthesis
LATLRRLKEDFGPNLIDSHFLYPDGYAATLLGAELGIPVTINIRGSKDQRLVGTACEAAMRWTAAHAQAVLAVSSRLVQDVALPLGLPPDRVTVIGNGVDLARFRPLDRLSARKRLGLEPEAKVLIGVGNLIELKGFQRVIPLLPGLRQRFPGLQYLIVGGSAQQADISAQLRSLAERHGVADIVRFCGPQSQAELVWFYSAADVFVLATAYEGWANVFLEAIACGLPVVTTRVGGNAEVIANPSVGTLVDYWAADDFAAAIEQALQRDWDRKVLLEYAAAHSWELRTRALLRFLVDAAETGGSQSSPVSRR